MGRVKISVVIPARWRGNRDRQRAPVPECSTCEPQRNEHRAILFFVFFPFFRLTEKTGEWFFGDSRKKRRRARVSLAEKLMAERWRAEKWGG